jgi:CDGSH-type Zn-finger protein
MARSTPAQKPRGPASRNKGTGLAPMKYAVEKAGDYWLCDCKHSSKKPLCDGTHKTLA